MPKNPIIRLNDRQIRPVSRSAPALSRRSRFARQFVRHFPRPESHFDLVRAGGGALRRQSNARRCPIRCCRSIELRARIVQVRNLARGETIADNRRLDRASRRTRLALVSVGYADGYPRPASASDHRLQVIVGGHRCPVAGAPSMDLLPVDVTDLPDPTAARYGEMVTLIGAEIGIDDLAAGSQIDRARSAQPVSAAASTASTTPSDKLKFATANATEGERHVRKIQR